MEPILLGAKLDLDCATNPGGLGLRNHSWIDYWRHDRTVDRVTDEESDQLSAVAGAAGPDRVGYIHDQQRPVRQIWQDRNCSSRFIERGHAAEEAFAHRPGVPSQLFRVLDRAGEIAIGGDDVADSGLRSVRRWKAA